MEFKNYIKEWVQRFLSILKMKCSIINNESDEIEYIKRYSTNSVFLKLQINHKWNLYTWNSEFKRKLRLASVKLPRVSKRVIEWTEI